MNARTITKTPRFELAVRIGMLAVVFAAGCADVDDAGAEGRAEPLTGGGARVHGQRWRDPNALQTAAAPAGAHLVYHGGRVITSAQVIEVVYGSGSFLSQITSSTTPNIPTFYGGVLNSPYVDWLTEYNTTSPNAPTPNTNQVIGRGGFVTRVTITPASSRNGSTITDAQIQAELSAQLAAGTLPAPTHDAAGNNNTYYAIFFPHGKTIVSSDGTSSCAAGGFCAYHSTVASAGGHGEVYYGVHPDMQAGSGCDVGCGSGTAFANQQSVASHELVESITDPEIGLATTIGPPIAWYDSTNGEIGDICDAQQGTIVGGDGVTYTVQKEFSNAAKDCIVAKAAPANDFSIAASPGSLTVAQGASATATVSTAVTAGSAQTIALSVSGAPAGTTTALAPASVTAGGAATLTVNVGAATAAGTYTLTVTGSAASGSHAAAVTLVVTAAGGGSCSGTFVSSDVPKAIPDNNAAGVNSTLAVTGAGVISSATITLHITHTWRGDLSGTLQTPGGAIVTAFARPNPNDSNDNIVLTAASLSGVAGLAAAGTWTLNVVDHAAQDVGTIDSWSLAIVCGTAPPPPPPPTCAHSECTTGVKLTSGCDACVTSICASDSFCCATRWDSVCVGEVSSICGATCP
jgi:subtilisin-like proprotein convertase family protein